MLWLFISLPVMLLAIAIAVVPVLATSAHLHREEHGRGHATGDTAPTPAAATAPREIAVACPICGIRIGAGSSELLVSEVERHAWRLHGIPSAPHVIETARAA